MIDYTSRQASEIMPVSGYEISTGLSQIQSEALDFFFKKSPLAYKIYKNAHAMSYSAGNNPKQFLTNFFNTLEESLKLQLKENNSATAENLVVVKNVFDIIQRALLLLDNVGIKVNIETLYAFIVAFILGKFK